MDLALGDGMEYLYKEQMLTRVRGLQYAPKGYVTVRVALTGFGKRENRHVFFEVYVTDPLTSKARKKGDRFFVPFDELIAIL